MVDELDESHLAQRLERLTAAGGWRVAGDSGGWEGRILRHMARGGA